jgi:hypothetical protein
MSGPPSLTILLPFEGAPRIWVDALTDAEAAHLWHWIDSRSDLVELVARALEIAEEARAA